MINKSPTCIALTILMLTLFISVSPHTSYASEADERPSATRSIIEATEEKTLGTEKHIQLEQIEPSIDNTISRSLPVAVGSASFILLVVAWYMKARKK